MITPPWKDRSGLTPWFMFKCAVWSAFYRWKTRRAIRRIEGLYH